MLICRHQKMRRYFSSQITKNNEQHIQPFVTTFHGTQPTTTNSNNTARPRKQHRSGSPTYRYRSESPLDAQRRLDKSISKILSQTLRHTAPFCNIPIDKAGYCQANHLLAESRLEDMGCKLDDLRRAVRENDKQRFQLKEDIDAIV